MEAPFAKPPSMSAIIRVLLERPGSPPARIAFREGKISDAPPMRFRGSPCRALQAQSVLSGSTERIAERAEWLFEAAASDADRLVFMDCSLGEPYGRLFPRSPADAAECADWVYDSSRRLWLGEALDANGRRARAPLFAFWLLQALRVANAWPSNPNLGGHAERLPDGSPRPAAARASLDWNWRDASEPRLELFALAHAARLDPGRLDLAERLALATHPQVALALLMIPIEKYALLAGSDLALRSLLESQELAASTLGAPAPARPNRL
jgi:hypothetical protein